VRTVFGLEPVSIAPDAVQVDTYANLSQAGVQPLKRKRGPSVRNDSEMTLLTLYTLGQFSLAIPGDICLTGFTPSTVTAFCILLFKTSAGAQAVVATVPARREAMKCVGIPSFRPRESLDSKARFAAE